ncbi:acylneuraminate cytidylyltransferase family protein [Umezawaea beigongshangensis]|uniref:acylneuraminate cytidylyltransferase family protein n=1 Tax=Umezawaea beigongshangensis TaxID=2780383 RepID=UPI0018F2279D|nr:acylneuraminate cytidylyltransferase family protein [Umezawaea beigongshangensis]
MLDRTEGIGRVAEQVVAVVPARGGSVGYPGKNLAPFLGRPLVAHAVATGAAARGVGRVLLTTDDDAIAAAGAAEGAEVVRRPAELATSESRTVDAVLHALGVADVPDEALVVLLQPTSPLRTSADVEECLALHGSRRTGSVVQVAESGEHHPWKACLLDDGVLVPSRNWEDLEAPRQALPPVLRPTGGVYVLRAGDLRRHGRFFVPAVLAQVVPTERAVDVDGEADLLLARRRATGAL